jgi:hypothetical protein
MRAKTRDAGNELHVTSFFFHKIILISAEKVIDAGFRMNRVLDRIGTPAEVDVVRESVRAVQPIRDKFDGKPVLFCCFDNPFEHRVSPAFNTQVRSEVGSYSMREHIARRSQRPKADCEFVAVLFSLSYRRRRGPAAADGHERDGKRGTH